MTTVTNPPTDVDSAVRLLDVTAQRGGFDGQYNIVRPVGGPTTIRLTSRDVFKAACDYGLMSIDNPYDIQVVGSDVHVPVVFGAPTRWRAVAVYPAQDPCACGAELVHQVGCPEIDDQETAVYEAAIAATNAEWAAEMFGPSRVDLDATERCYDCGFRHTGSCEQYERSIALGKVGRGEALTPREKWIVDAPAGSAWGAPDLRCDDLDAAPECVECSGLGDSHQAWCLFAAARIPVVVLDVPSVHFLAVSADTEYACGLIGGAGSMRQHEVTCEDCQTMLAMSARIYGEATALPQRTPGAALADNPPLTSVVDVLLGEAADR